MSVGVIFGGRSVEHDVSVVTAHQVMEALDGRYGIVPIYVTREGVWFSSPALNDLSVYREKRWQAVADEVFLPPVTGCGGLRVPGRRLRGERTIPLDVVIPAIHGTFGEDGTLQGLLELADLPYTGSGVVASAVGMDKVTMKAAFEAAGLPVIPHCLVVAAQLETDRGAVINRCEQAIGYPAFVKPSRLGSSVGIGKAADRASLSAALEVARSYDRRILVEKAMEGCIEVNCSVLGGGNRPPRASVCEQPIPWEEYLSFSDKYMRGGKSSKSDGMAGQERRIPAPISAELAERVEKNAIAAFAAVDAGGVARIDAFLNEEAGETWVMEINTIPGSFSFYLWAHSGLSFSDLLEELIDIALETHAAKSELMFTFDSGMLESAPGVKVGG
ncbi:MAG: D-alanine--D-alanine ligase [Actinomycetota bacterium]|nr:D-alanine--D-alanine ligase [Actinomycetota bacterium]